MMRMLWVACAVALAGTAVAAAPAPGPANAWFGTWKLRLKDAGEKPETLIYRDAGDGAMRMESVEEGSVLVTRFDGRPATDVGRTGRKGRTLAVRAMSPTRYRWTFSIAGKPHVAGINTLSADGKMFTEVSWPVAKPGDMVTLIYERQ